MTCGVDQKGAGLPTMVLCSAIEIGSALVFVQDSGNAIPQDSIWGEPRCSVLQLRGSSTETWTIVYGTEAKTFFLMAA